MLRRISQRLIQIVTIAILFAGLTGCGFALRGNVDLPDALNNVAITGSDREMASLLEDALESSGATVVDRDDESAAQLDLVESEFTRDVRTTDSNGRATAYTLRYNVRYDLRESNGEEIQINQAIKQIRVLQYDPLQELQSEEESDFLKEEMQEELVLQILRRLSRI